MMKVDDIRNKYLEFFESKGHTRVASDSLVPHDDPTLLFTGAGMNQFKEYFLGLKKDMTRATSVQKCLRTGDLEEVGRTAYHHSFFEMLGNFSFGDYFKKEAITWAWEFLTEVLGISESRLRVTVHKTDEEAYTFWRDEVKIREDWIYQMGDKSNYWPSNAPKDGPNGPCGPCSEIYYDMSASPEDPAEDLESARFAEIWNLVFTQFDRGDGGKLTPLANQNIDTGMGLERLASVLQGKTNNFEIDLFQPIHEQTLNVLGLEKIANDKLSHRNAIADHIRSISFCIYDGAMPGNEGRGYVVRKILRRALWHGLQLVPSRNLQDAFLYRLIPTVAEVMHNGYPELKDSVKSIANTVKAEEERFLTTLESGTKILENRLADLRTKKQKIVPGDIVFELYDTYGFPDELTLHIAEENGFTIDREGFEKAMEAQRQRAKDASRISGSIFVTDELEEQILKLPETKFLGYESGSSAAKVLLAKVEAGKGLVILDQSPFYGESGGQVGDRGILTWTDGQAKVTDTQKNNNRLIHFIEFEAGELKNGQDINAQICSQRRLSVMRNHTATHLLHAALRNVLGDQVRQLGSLVDEDKLRFDYSYGQPLTDEQIDEIESQVNEEILKNTCLAKSEKTIDEAKKAGALAFFGEKYGEKVRVVEVGDFSKELCGGTHCDATGDIGSFVILSESSVASGTRRIEAATGKHAIEYRKELQAQLRDISASLKTPVKTILPRIQKLQETVKKLEKSANDNVLQAADPKKIISGAMEIGNLKFANHYLGQGSSVGDLRKLSDSIRQMSAKTLYFLGSETDEKVHYVIGLSPDLKDSALDAREVLKAVSTAIGGTGGGRKELVQGGAQNQGQFKQSWDSIKNQFVEFLKERKI